MMKKFLLIIVVVTSFVSCGGKAQKQSMSIEEIADIAEKIPIAPATHIPLSALWTQIIGRAINYVSEESKINETDVFTIENNIQKSINSTFTKAPGAIVYENYSNPFSLQMIIRSLNKNIDKILFRKLDLECANEVYKNLLLLPLENKEYSFSWWANDGHSAWSGDNKIFGEPVEITIEKNENSYIDGIYIYFSDIPVNYEIDSNIVLHCVLEVQFNNGLNKMIEYKIEYVRKIEEMKKPHFLRNPDPKEDDSYREITVDEWKEHI